MPTPEGLSRLCGSCALRFGASETGCRSALDQYKLVPRAEMPDYEQRVHAWTVEQLGR